MIHKSGMLPDSTVEVFRDALSDADARTREALREFIDRIDARGGTELFQGLDAASKLLGRGGGDIFLLTDGQVSGTEDIIKRSRRLGIRVHCLGIGSASQDRFLAQLSRETGGVSRFVTPRERVDQAALELFAAIGRPVATDIHVKPEGFGDASLAPDPAPTVFGGHPLVVYGESGGSLGTLVVEWTHEGSARSLALPVNAGAATDAATLKLIRGARLITDLESRLGAEPGRHAAGAQDSKRDERLLAELGRTYGLANRQLSLVSVVKRPGDRAGQVPVTRVMPVGMPQDTEFEAYFDRSAGVAAPASVSYSLGNIRKCPLPRASMFKRAELMAMMGPTRIGLDFTDLCTDLAGRLEPDGGLPGKTEAARICHTLVALLALLEHPSAAYAPHCARLRAFLERADLTRLSAPIGVLVQTVVDRARRQIAMPGEWAALADALIRHGSKKCPSAWRAMKKAIRP